MLCLDNINDIIKKLSRKDLYTLSNVSIFYYKLINFKQLIIDTIHIRLKFLLKEHYEPFLKIMKHNGAFISGSFIIQCILNEYWDSDIDVFCPSIGNVNRIHKFDDESDESDESEENDRKKYTFNEIEDYLFNEMEYDGSSECILYRWDTNDIKTHPQIRNVRTYTKENKCDIQIISINLSKNISDCYSFIENRFDFDICKNIYDGDLIIKNIENILNKTTNFNATTSLTDSIGRYHKYVLRGFNFENKTTIKYTDLVNSDQYLTRVYSYNINEVHESIKNFILVEDVSQSTKMGKYIFKCENCIITFCDSFSNSICRHSHFHNYHKNMKLTHDIIIH